jgi:quercetin dioxygenase-like cupin family protein
MDDSAIFKIWGERRRILLTDKCEIDLLYLKKNTFCSTHRHKTKINRFYVVSGQVRIETEFGTVLLMKGDNWEIRPPVKHRFYAYNDSTMIEMAYIEKGKIRPDDIQRETQGGKKINGIEYTEDELKEKGLLEL